MTATLFSPSLDNLIEGLRCLPGIGPKSAQRIAFHLLQHNRDGGLQLSIALQQSMTSVQYCHECRNFSETERCHFCANTNRDNTLLCIVETPADIIAIEHSGGYRGRYFVLQGHLSPLDGIGPKELGLDQLVQYVKDGSVKEIILATNPTIEGEVTAHHIAKLLAPFSLHITRIAHGVPMGGELEYVDGQTLSRAISSRTAF